MLLKTIVLYGPSQCGKTHSLNYLAEKLQQQFKARLLEKRSNGDGSSASDNLYALELSLEEKSIIVIITTQGDYIEALRNNYSFLEEYRNRYSDEDFFWFTASRTKGKTVSFLEEKDSLTDLLWFRKGHVDPIESLQSHKTLIEEQYNITANYLVSLFYLLSKQEIF